MSSPNIKLNMLIRKYKNGLKEGLDKKKIIHDYTYQLSNNEVLLTNHIYIEKNKNKYVYKLHDLYDLYNILKIKYNEEEFDIKCMNSSNYSKCDKNKIINDTKKIIPSTTIPIPFESNNRYNPSSEECLYSISPYETNFIETGLFFNDIDQNPIDNSDSLEDYIGETGFLSKIYNAELCDENWIIMMYFINRLYANFVNKDDNLKLRSIHINILPGSKISALHHFLHNSKILNTYKHLQWDWVGTVNDITNDPYDIKQFLRSRYKNNILELFDDLPLYSINNINYIINETLTKHGKRNLLCSDITELINNDSSEEEIIKYFITFAVLIIKLLDASCIFYMELPETYKWNVSIVNGLVLYSLMFQEIYLFKFDISKQNHKMILICKNKKKITNESIYKKLINLLSNKKFNSNLFSKDFLYKDCSDVVKQILYIINNNEVKSVVFEDIIYEIKKVLDINHDTLLY